jgi:hypothetical protein
MATSKRHRPTRKIILKDREPQKRYPSSIGLTVLALRQYWLQEIGKIEKNTPAISVDDFMRESGFERSLLQIMSLYPDISRPQYDSPEKQMYKIPQHQTNMDYYKLRAFAKYTGLRSTGVFLLFTQLVGEELRAINEGRDPRSACLEILEGVKRMIDRTKQYLDQPTDRILPGRYFWKQYQDAPGEYGLLPNMELLKLWRDAFLDGPLPPDSTADDDDDSSP